MKKKRAAKLALLACASVASLGLIAGASPAAAKTKKKTVTKTAAFNQCVGTSSPIRDADTGVNVASAVIPVTVPAYRGVPQTGVVSAITSVGTHITHTFSGDLAITLISPGGKVISLASYPNNGEGDVGADGYGTGTSCAGSLVLFGDGFGISAATPVTDPDSNNPITGSLRPLQPLSQVVGGPAAGAWTLLVYDGQGGDEGTLDSLSLNFTYQFKALVKVKKKKKKH
jgi:subtilisin-like proprotein convertase family protein